MDADEKKHLHQEAHTLADALQRPQDRNLIEASLIQAWLRGKHAGLARAEEIAKTNAARGAA